MKQLTLSGIKAKSTYHNGYTTDITIEKAFK